MRRWLPFIATVVVLVAELPLLVPPPFGLTDHLLFWYAGHLTVSGGSPYDGQAWIDAQRTYSSAHLRLFIDEGSPVWVYPAWTVFLFAPFGLLPFPVGPWVLYLAYVGIGLAGTVLFIRALPADRRARAYLALPIAAIFNPLMIANRYGQFGSFLLLGAVLVYLGLDRRRAGPLTAGSLILFAKPQMFLVLAPTVLAILVARRAWRTTALVTVALAAVAIGTTLRYPESIAEFSRGAGARGAAFAQYSTTWAFAHYLAGDRWPAVGAGFVVLAAVATIVGVRRLPDDLRLAGVVAGAALLSVVVAPVDFHYDQVPLVLAVVLAVAVARRPHQIAVIAVAGGLIPWLAYFLALGIGGPDSQALSGVVPLLFAGAFWLATRTPSPAMTASSPAIARTPANAK